MADRPVGYYKSKYPDAVKHVGELIGGVPSSEVQAAGEDAAMEHEGYTIVYSRTYGPLETDFTADVIHMESAGVEAVNLTSVDATVAARFLQEANTQGFHPKLVFSGGPIYADNFVSLAGGAAVVNGAYLNQTESLYLGEDAKTIPAVGEFLKWVHGLYPGFPIDLFTYWGWASADLFVQGLKNAGSSPTQSSLLQALGQITSFTAGGMQAASNPAGKQPAPCYLLAQIVNGQFQRTDMPATGFRCDGSFYAAPSS